MKHTRTHRSERTLDRNQCPHITTDDESDRSDDNTDRTQGERDLDRHHEDYISGYWHEKAAYDKHAEIEGKFDRRRYLVLAHLKEQVGLKALAEEEPSYRVSTR